MENSILEKLNIMIFKKDGKSIVEIIKKKDIINVHFMML